ncbi:PorT family protein [Empedobacter brevis]|uniref:PorT family protein n=1 Tax=Empedobacter brevis TaxID=247 RepID=A0AAJ1QE36_9FLAO|nr:PorT family protein [Empedobacter brevis]MDM1072222.1 PorT family protein [Empedobacter brevis]
MIKKIIAVGLLCLSATSLYAQKFTFDLNDKNDEKISPIVRDRISEFTLVIRQIVQEEKGAMEKKIIAVDKELAEGKLTASEATARKEEIANVYSETINDRIQEVNFNLDDIIKQQVAFSIMNGDPVTPKTKQDVTKRYRIVNQINGYGSFGYMAFTGKKDEELNQHEKFSSNLTAGMIYERQLSLTSPLNFLTGALFSWRTYRLDDDMRFNRDENGNIGVIKSEKSLDKSKLRSAYFMVPVGFKYNFSKVKNITEDFAYRPEAKHYIAAYVYGGTLLSSNNIYKGDGVRNKQRGNYNVNNFIYGAEVTIGLGLIDVFVRKDFNTYFKDNTFDNRKMIQFGINLGL